ncbi:unnamed protein product [Thlaspi arvense]|uniref:Histone deacetylase interacting domain-containing protein n=1 Tax=Thlaspi arvense TaxID=13288 RepID=A0AAU9RZU9_THLAR|nr:unnamed protein product [Thlaspi arvense]
MEDDSKAKTIKKRLSPSELITYDSSLLRLLENDDYLHQRFTEVANELQEEQEETQDDEVTYTEESIHDHPSKIESELQNGVKADENAKEDPPVRGESNIEDDLDIRVKDKNLKEDVTDEGESEKGIFLHSDGSIEESSDPMVKISPSYTLIPEENRSPVSDTVLNNEAVQVKVDTSKPNKLTGYAKATARYEDELYESDMLIEFVRGALERGEKVMKREMRMEDVGEKFYSCIEQLYRGAAMVKELRSNYQEALPKILPRLKQKLDDLKVSRQRLHFKRPPEKK